MWWMLLLPCGHAGPSWRLTSETRGSQLQILVQVSNVFVHLPRIILKLVFANLRMSINMSSYATICDGRSRLQDSHRVAEEHRMCRAERTVDGSYGVRRNAHRARVCLLLP
jgi:hypothetical protein